MATEEFRAIFWARELCALVGALRSRNPWFDNPTNFGYAVKLQGEPLQTQFKFLKRGGALTLAAIACCGIAYAKPRTNRIVVVISLDGFPASALNDPKLPIPTLRRLAGEGMVAASMQPVNPTVTWPNHTAMVTGVDALKHQVLFNGLLDRGALPLIEPWRDKERMVHAPTIYDLAYSNGLTTAQVDWVAIYNAKTITWQFPELPDPKGAIERGMVADGIVTEEQLRTFEDSSQVWQDQMWTTAAVRILKQHQPNLLLFHLLTLDSMSHEYGPANPPSFTAMAFLDSQVKQILDVIERNGLGRRTTVLVVSDHGFRSIQHKLHPNVLLKQAGLFANNLPGSNNAVWCIPEGGTAMVYITDPGQRSALVPKVRSVLAGAEGIEQVYDVKDFLKLGLPTPAQSNQAPDLFLAAKPGYGFSADSEGDFVTAAAEGTHGFLNTDPQMQAIFIAWGAGIPKGYRIATISNRDVAPTIAHLLGLEMKGVDGQAIPAIADYKPSTTAH